MLRPYVIAALVFNVFIVATLMHAAQEISVLQYLLTVCLLLLVLFSERLFAHFRNIDERDGEFDD